MTPAPFATQDAGQRFQKRNLRANWSCREAVAVAVTTPAVGETAAAADGFAGVGPLLKTTALGVVKLV